MKKFGCIIAVIMGVVGLTGLVMTPAWADCKTDHPDDKNCVDTIILGQNNQYQNDDKGSGVWYILNIIVTVLTFGVGIAGTIGIIISGIQYMTASDDEAKVKAAKQRILNIVIGMAAFALLWAGAQFFLPGL